MVETPLALTHEEREYLVELLQSALNHTRVEEHRTRTPLYRQQVLDREDVIVGLLSKLRLPA